MMFNLALIHEAIAERIPEREGKRISADELIEASRDFIAAFKLPRRVIFVDEVVRAPSGKADYRWAKSRALEASDADV
jgi:fatty-acyl-CoA synthase